MKMVVLSPLSDNSLYADNVQELAIDLLNNGWNAVQPRHTTEYARRKRGRDLVIIFNNGTVLPEGPRADRVLDELVTIYASHKHFMGRFAPKPKQRSFFDGD